MLYEICEGDDGRPRYRARCRVRWSELGPDRLDDFVQDCNALERAYDLAGPDESVDVRDFSVKYEANNWSNVATKCYKHFATKFREMGHAGPDPESVGKKKQNGRVPRRTTSTSC